MTDKKEVLDYLRNKQKAQEIDAKVNGINLWVLLGALALVVWQIIASLNAPIWPQKDLILRVLLVTEAVYLVTWVSQKSQGITDDIRYSSDSGESSFEGLFLAVLLLMPPGLFVTLVDRRWSAMAILVIGLLFTSIALSLMASGFIKGSGKKKFPEPSFGLTKKANARAEWIVIAVLVAVTVDQAWLLWLDLSSASVDSVKLLTLLAAAFLLLLIAVRRRLRTDAVLWTYEMETELVLGVISAKVALSRIENRALGPRVKDVMDEFIEDIEKRFSELSSMIAKCSEDLAAAHEVPAKYQVERSSRIAGAAGAPRAHIEKLFLDIAEFDEYLKKLASPNRTRRRPELLGLLESLGLKQKDYETRAAREKKALESLIADAQSSINSNP
ncbi:MAG: hypothetical protein Q8R06_10935 [Polaromonas sp.]|uniref:hypothetical protein n=1 Tax=Polaromonas sp. TaxID=1869339 RepID=UPI002733DA9D|nr:hypothetical protein [Polaromonas sp.]MDP3797647.1 hypothetical protein [Polaromonas sp.]